MVESELGRKNGGFHCTQAGSAVNVCYSIDERNRSWKHQIGWISPDYSPRLLNCCCRLSNHAPTCFGVRIPFCPQRGGALLHTHLPGQPLSVSHPTLPTGRRQPQWHWALFVLIGVTPAFGASYRTDNFAV